MNTPDQRAANEPRRWLDHPGNVRKIYYSVWVVCTLLLLAELLIDKHGETEIEHLFGFHGLYGFIACVLLVLAAKLLRRALYRPEDYYDNR